MTQFYQMIVQELQALLKAQQQVLAAWEGGSAATGYLDEYSDLDLQIIVQDDFVEAAFDLVEGFLHRRYQISHKFRVPEPAWHGNSQAFYLSENFARFFYLDFFVIKASSSRKFTESNRHGKAKIWFDRENLIDSSPLPDQEIMQRCRATYQRVVQYFPFALQDVRKHILRQNKIDAMAIYQGLLNRYVALLNLKYRPAKYDFGLRYLYRDLPIQEWKKIEKLTYNKDLAALSDSVDQIEIDYKQLKAELTEKILG
jgi:hypothetical protein